ncbi:MAG: DUF835 domain-containing protein [Methanomassiliicoccales archaeon]
MNAAYHEMQKGYFQDMEGNIRIFEKAEISEDIHADGDLWIGREAVIRASVYVAGDLIMEMDSRIEGSATVRGSANFKDGSRINGRVQIDGVVYRGNNPPQHMFRRKQSIDIPEENSYDRKARELIEKGKIGRGTFVTIHEVRPELSYALLRSYVSRGLPCMLIGREPPERVRSARGVALEDDNIIWLTTLVGRRCVNPTHLSSIMASVSRFMETTSDGFLLVDGIEYLITNNGFEQVLKFINRLQDMIASGRIRVVLTLDPRTVDEQSVALIERGASIIEQYDEPDGKMGQTANRHDVSMAVANRSSGEDALGRRLDDFIYTVRDEIEELKRMLEETQEKLFNRLEGLTQEAGKDEEETAAVEEQLRENAELLLRAVLLTEKLSSERMKGEKEK